MIFIPKYYSMGKHLFIAASGILVGIVVGLNFNNLPIKPFLIAIVFMLTLALIVTTQNYIARAKKNRAAAIEAKKTALAREKEKLAKKLSLITTDYISKELHKIVAVDGDIIEINISPVNNELHLLPGDLLKIPIVGFHLFIGVGTNVNQLTEYWFLGSDARGVCCFTKTLIEKVKKGVYKPI